MILLTVRPFSYFLVGLQFIQRYIIHIYICTYTHIYTHYICTSYFHPAHFSLMSHYNCQESLFIFSFFFPAN